jgi:hypothetical protein
VALDVTRAAGAKLVGQPIDEARAAAAIDGLLGERG